jgi:hypothetical protein
MSKNGQQKAQQYLEALMSFSLQLFRSDDLEKTNLCFTLYADIRFFVKLTCNKTSNQVANFSVSLHPECSRPKYVETTVYGTFFNLTFFVIQ